MGVSTSASTRHAARAGQRARALRDKERAENFPVALRLLPRRYRLHLCAVYDVVRVIDDLGDEASGDRTAQLHRFAADLARLWCGGTPAHPALRRLGPTVWACRLPREPFDRLLAANLRDQRVGEYATFDDLRGYCALSADPVGRIVLAIFGLRGPELPELIALSDRVCTALQLLEHWQDVAEDRRNGRIYLPGADRAEFAVRPIDLDAPIAPDRLRRLVAAETHRAVRLLDAGAPLVGRVHGWARVAIAGYVAGGYAAADALARAKWDVLTSSPRVRGKDVLRHFMLLLGRGCAGGHRAREGSAS